MLDWPRYSVADGDGGFFCGLGAGDPTIIGNIAMSGRLLVFDASAHKIGIGNGTDCSARAIDLNVTRFDGGGDDDAGRWDWSSWRTWAVLAACVVLVLVCFACAFHVCVRIHPRFRALRRPRLVPRPPPLPTTTTHQEYAELPAQLN